MDKKYLRQAINKAIISVHTGGGPFGAIVVKDGEVISEASNLVTTLNDPTAHAEILAIREAAAKLGSWDLKGCILYTSCEPCPMCLGAAYWAHFDKIYYACNHLDAKEAGFDDTHIYDELKKDVGKRKLPMIQDLRDEGLEAFLDWNKKEDKRKY